MRVWRISSYADLLGEGGRVAASRWNPINTPIVYCADHPASAILEMLVHIDPEDAPLSYQLLEIEVPDEVVIEEPELPIIWRRNIKFTQRIGAQFIESGSTPVMAVPSVIVPFAVNYLLNPELVKGQNIHIVGCTKHPIDPRLLG